MKYFLIFVVLILSFSCSLQDSNTSQLSWKLSASLQDSAVYSDIFFIDSKKGWLVGNPGMTFHSNDGGQSWTIQDSIQKYLLFVHFIDDQYGWATGTQSAYYTVNSGSLWNYEDLVCYICHAFGITFKVIYIDRENVVVFSHRPANNYVGASRHSFDIDSAKFSWVASYLFIS